MSNESKIIGRGRANLLAKLGVGGKKVDHPSTASASSPIVRSLSSLSGSGSEQESILTDTSSDASLDSLSTTMTYGSVHEARAARRQADHQVVEESRAIERLKMQKQRDLILQQNLHKKLTQRALDTLKAWLLAQEEILEEDESRTIAYLSRDLAQAQRLKKILSEFQNLSSEPRQEDIENIFYALGDAYPEGLPSEMRISHQFLMRYYEVKKNETRLQKELKALQDQEELVEVHFLEHMAPIVDEAGEKFPEQLTQIMLRSGSPIASIALLMSEIAAAHPSLQAPIQAAFQAFTQEDDRFQHPDLLSSDIIAWVQERARTHHHWNETVREKRQAIGKVEKQARDLWRPWREVKTTLVARQEQLSEQKEFQEEMQELLVVAMDLARAQYVVPVKGIFKKAPDLSKFSAYDQTKTQKVTFTALCNAVMSVMNACIEKAGTASRSAELIRSQFKEKFGQQMPGLFLNWKNLATDFQTLMDKWLDQAEVAEEEQRALDHVASQISLEEGDRFPLKEAAHALETLVSKQVEEKQQAYPRAVAEIEAKRRHKLAFVEEFLSAEEVSVRALSEVADSFAAPAALNSSLQHASASSLPEGTSSQNFVEVLVFGDHQITLGDILRNFENTRERLKEAGYSWISQEGSTSEFMQNAFDLAKTDSVIRDALLGEWNAEENTVKAFGVEALEKLYKLPQRIDTSVSEEIQTNLQIAFGGVRNRLCEQREWWPDQHLQGTLAFIDHALQLAEQGDEALAHALMTAWNAEASENDVPQVSEWGELENHYRQAMTLNSPISLLQTQSAEQANDWDYVDFTKHAILGGVLRGSFRHANFAGMDLRGMDLKEALLEGANFQGAKMDHTTILPKALAGVDLSEVELSESLLDLSNCLFTETSKLPRDLRHCCFDGATFSKMRFTAVNGLVAKNATFDRVQFSGLCQSWDLREATFKSVAFGANFEGQDWLIEKSTFTGRTFVDGIFTGDHSILSDCEIEELSTHRTEDDPFPEQHGLQFGGKIDRCYERDLFKNTPFSSMEFAEGMKARQVFSGFSTLSEGEAQSNYLKSCIPKMASAEELKALQGLVDNSFVELQTVMRQKLAEFAFRAAAERPAPVLKIRQLRDGEIARRIRSAELVSEFEGIEHPGMPEILKRLKAGGIEGAKDYILYLAARGELIQDESYLEIPKELVGGQLSLKHEKPYMIAYCLQDLLGHAIFAESCQRARASEGAKAVFASMQDQPRLQFFMAQRVLLLRRGNLTPEQKAQVKKIEGIMFEDRGALGGCVLSVLERLRKDHQLTEDFVENIPEVRGQPLYYLKPCGGDVEIQMNPNLVAVEDLLEGVNQLSPGIKSYFDEAFWMSLKHFAFAEPHFSWNAEEQKIVWQAFQQPENQTSLQNLCQAAETLLEQEDPDFRASPSAAELTALHQAREKVEAELAKHQEFLEEFVASERYLASLPPAPKFQSVDELHAPASH